MRRIATALMLYIAGVNVEDLGPLGVTDQAARSRTNIKRRLEYILS